MNPNSDRPMSPEEEIRYQALLDQGNAEANHIIETIKSVMVRGVRDGADRDVMIVGTCRWMWANLGLPGLSGVAANAILRLARLEAGEDETTQVPLPKVDV